MTTLSALGALSGATTFPSRLPDHFDELLPMGSENDRAFAEEIVSYLDQNAPGSPIARSLSRRIRQSRRHAASRSYVHNSGLAVALPTVRKLRGAAVRFTSIISHIR